jgi:hypothetical protein
MREVSIAMMKVLEKITVDVRLAKRRSSMADSWSHIELFREA